MGTISGTAVSVCHNTVHPHGRGDNLLFCDAQPPFRGSPPRAWGQLDEFGAVSVRHRFTPTGVGTICDGAEGEDEDAVHPHGRGDNGQAQQFRRYRRGSPPRAWGQSAQTADHTSDERFTPTGVGTISSMIVLASLITVHPHGRGDNAACGRKMRCSNGSPPRAWGQFFLIMKHHQRRRFTPTGVGTMPRVWQSRCSRTVHPHGRGDNRDVFDSFLIRNGSPPRAWGQLSNCLSKQLCNRFTPTGVGTILASQAF